MVDEALRWDGLFPAGLPGAEAPAELVSEVREVINSGLAWPDPAASSTVVIGASEPV